MCIATESLLLTLELNDGTLYILTGARFQKRLSSFKRIRKFPLTVLSVENACVDAHSLILKLGNHYYSIQQLSI